MRGQEARESGSPESRTLSSLRIMEHGLIPTDKTLFQPLNLEQGISQPKT